MIIELIKGKINILPMAIPELSNYLRIQYRYESGTNHLTPRLTINKDVYNGDRVFVDIKDGYNTGEISCKVELLDGQANVIRTYVGTIPLYNYTLLGKKPVRPDFEVYIHKLETDIEDLHTRYKAEIELMRVQHQLEIDNLNLVIDHLNLMIKELEEKGEVI